MGRIFLYVFGSCVWVNVFFEFFQSKRSRETNKKNSLDKVKHNLALFGAYQNSYFYFLFFFGDCCFKLKEDIGKFVKKNIILRSSRFFEIENSDISIHATVYILLQKDDYYHQSGTQVARKNFKIWNFPTESFW